MDDNKQVSPEEALAAQWEIERQAKADAYREVFYTIDIGHGGYTTLAYAGHDKAMVEGLVSYGNVHQLAKKSDVVEIIVYRPKRQLDRRVTIDRGRVTWKTEYYTALD